jgi:adenylate cyclase
VGTVHGARGFEAPPPGNTNLVEIERKFLVTGDPEGEPAETWHIEQGYLALADDGGAEVRLRRAADDLFLTVKGGAGRSRVEEEIDIDDEVLESLWPLTEGRRITKTRHRIPHGERKIDLDVFEGQLEGLRLAEVEFPDDQAADAFEPPEWFGQEVTGDRRYLNETLATEGAPE